MKRVALASAGVLVLGVPGCGDISIGAVPMAESAPVVPFQVELDPEVRKGVVTASTARVDCDRAKCIALTFDDGPEKDTARLLGMLAEYDAKATFFVVGTMVKEDPDMVRQAVEGGHEIANHSWDHSNLAGMSTKEVKSQLARTNEVVSKAAGVTPMLLRPPYGATNARVASAARSFGMPQILWAVDPLDWKDRSSSVVARRVIAHARRNDVVLMHDIHPTTVSAVPKILSVLTGKGFTFVTVTELFSGKRLRPGRQYTKR